MQEVLIMSFKVDHSQAGSSELPEGEYEAIIKYAGEDATKISRTEYINVTMVVRNDIDQAIQSTLFQQRHKWLTTA